MSYCLILGGARSGKSALAERLARHPGCDKVYVATAGHRADDADMADRIARHRAARGSDWHLVEAPFDLCTPLDAARTDQILLIDCATLWLSNHMLAGSDLASEAAALIGALSACAADVVIVSNETGMGIVPETRLGRRFRDAQGLLNQQLAARADHVAFVLAGLPLVLKGRLPWTD